MPDGLSESTRDWRADVGRQTRLGSRRQRLAGHLRPDRRRPPTELYPTTHLMADPKAIQFLEGLYSRVDKQVRDIVASMLPNQSVGAQEDGTVVANQWNILNFQGPGVSVS